MKFFFTLFLFIFSGANSFEKKNSFELSVQISPMKAIQGKLFLALHNTSDTFLEDEKDPFMSKVLPVTSKELQTSWQVPAGNYAISVFHGVNNNGKLDTNFLGIPTEPYGFSNNPKGLFGPPSYEQAMMKIEKSDNTKILLD